MVRFQGRILGLATLILASGMLLAQDLLAQDHSLASFPSANSNEIPEGKSVLIRLGQRLETRTARPGQHFKAFLAEDLVAPN